ncbi:hypothetical protein [Lacipirellula sp.]|uniref:hypothetical protein n=1 Tax=Lacipirellula sp. TaxID=2691419 RepID=UPI003D0D08CE
MRLSTLVALTLVIAIATPLRAENAVSPPAEIPLDTIWGLDLPGTRDIEGVDLPTVPQASSPGWGYPEFKRRRQEIIERVRTAISSKPPVDQALTGFVYSVAPDMETLTVLMRIENAFRNNKSQVRNNFIHGDRDAFLVFYSHPSSYYLRLKKVTRDGTDIDVSYVFEPHYTADSTVHLALIPLGKLPPGEYNVRFTQQPMERKYIDAGFVRVFGSQEKQIVCQPFTFLVSDPPPFVTSEDPIEERVPLDRIWALSMPGTKKVRELDPRESPDQETAVSQIARGLLSKIGQQTDAGPCFLVAGEGKEALENAASVIADNASPLTALTTDDEISLVFYSYAAPGYVALHSVRKAKNQVTVRYHVMMHATSDVSVHFALIPLGKLSPGKLNVDVMQVGRDKPSPLEGVSRPEPKLVARAVCKSCAFEIREPDTTD